MTGSPGYELHGNGKWAAVGIMAILEAYAKGAAVVLAVWTILLLVTVVVGMVPRMTTHRIALAPPGQPDGDATSALPSPGPSLT